MRCLTDPSIPPPRPCSLRVTAKALKTNGAMKLKRRSQGVFAVKPCMEDTST